MTEQEAERLADEMEIAYPLAQVTVIRGLEHYFVHFRLYGVGQYKWQDVNLRAATPADWERVRKMLSKGIV